MAGGTCTTGLTTFLLPATIIAMSVFVAQVRPTKSKCTARSSKNSSECTCWGQKYVSPSLSVAAHYRTCSLSAIYIDAHFRHTVLWCLTTGSGRAQSPYSNTCQGQSGCAVQSCCQPNPRAATTKCGSAPLMNIISSVKTLEKWFHGRHMETPKSKNSGLQPARPKSPTLGAATFVELTGPR